MRIIKLIEPSLDKDWSMQFMDESHYDQLIDQPVKIYKPDGSPLLVLLKSAIDPKIAANAWTGLRTINGKTNNRATASGTNLVRINKQMVVPKGWQVLSAIIGSYERNIRMPFAHHCAWDNQHPELFERVVPMLQVASNHFSEHIPDRFAVQMDYVNRTNKNWVIPGTAYTTITVNKNFRTAAHKDAGDLEAGFSNMIIIRQGKMTGGHLVLPNWRLAVKLDNLDLVMFDAHEFHGNTAIVKMSSDAVRCSLVCYYRKNMIKCGSPEYELEQAKNRKPGQPIYWEQDAHSNHQPQEG